MRPFDPLPLHHRPACRIPTCRGRRAWICVFLGLFQLIAACHILSEEPDLDLWAQRLSEEITALRDAERYAEAIPLAEALVANQKELFGPDDVETAHCLNVLGYLLRKSGRASSAVPHHEAALRIFERTPGAEEPILQTVDLLSLAWWQAGDAAHAVPHLERAVDLSRAIYGAEHLETARRLGNLGRLLLDLNDSADARQAFAQALAIVDELDPQHPERSRYLSGLGSALKAQGDYQGARAYFEGALDATVRTQGADHPDVATDHGNLGTVLELLGELEAAESHYERAFELDRRHRGDRHPSTATSLGNLGSVRERRGDYASAKQLFEEALSIREEVFGKDDPETAITLTNLGHLLKTSGDLLNARRLYERALEIRKKRLGLKHPKTAASLNNLGAIEEALGNLPRARELYEQALAIRREALGPEHPSTAISLNNLGLVAAAMGDPVLALKYLTEALAIREEVYPPDHPEIATNVANLGSLFHYVGDLENVRAYSERALAMRIRNLGPEHPTTALGHHNLGMTLLQLGDLEGSRTHLERSLAIRERVLGADHPDVTKSLLGLAALEREAGNVERALLLTRRAADSHEKWLGPLLTAGSDAEKRLFLRTQLGLASWAITLHLRSSPSSADAARLALTLILRDKGRALEAELAKRGGALGQAADPIRVEAVQAALPAKTALIELFVFNPFDVREKPNPWGEERYAAYILRASGEPAAVDLGAVRELDEVVTGFRTALAERRQDVREWARKLDALTMERIRPLLGDATRLVGSPDGELNLVPFAALVEPPGNYLIERFGLSYVTSGRDLLREPPAMDEVGPPLVIGGPDFGAVPASWQGSPDPAGPGDFLPATFEELAGAAGEAVAIGKILGLPAERVLIGPAATEAAVKAAERPRILHLATHGFFLSGLPVATVREPFPDLLTERANETRQDAYLKSALALAGFNRRQGRPTDDDGVLTALEVLELDLWGTELVVLSACETGVGEARVGNGVFGLRRAFALAGARSQMTSLWQVADKATERLMVSWYTQVQEGVPGAEALRQIQLAALRGELLPATQTGLVRGVRPGVNSVLVTSRHPYYWASFLYVESSSTRRSF